MTVLSNYDLSFEYADLLRRLGAGLIDLIVLNIGMAALFTLFNLEITTEQADMRDFLLAASLLWFYSAAMESSSRQATLGKIALGLIVADDDGRPVSFGRASVRALGKVVSMSMFGLGFITVVFTKRKQAAHDMLAGAIVIRRANDER